jgi:hypothetical protein
LVEFEDYLTRGKAVRFRSAERAEVGKGMGEGGWMGEWVQDLFILTHRKGFGKRRGEVTSPDALWGRGWAGAAFADDSARRGQSQV